MAIERRGFVAGAAALGLTGHVAQAQEKPAMYGLIGRMLANPGKRDELIAVLTAGTGAMPGCLSYVIARDPTNADGIWITEVWESRASHQASLKLLSVQQAIAQARPLIAGFAERFETEPVAGLGLDPRYFR